MKRIPTTRSGRRTSAGPQIILAAAAAGGSALLARSLRPDDPPDIDLRVRAAVTARVPRVTRKVLAPLFPVGLPGGYIAVAYGTSIWLRKRRRAGGPAIVTSAWLGWLVQRGLKLVYIRDRPRRRGVARRMDSYPSGHTTGVTAVALTTALVLHRRELLSSRAAGALAIGAPLVMGAYRIIDDEHWLTDVLGGWMLGGAIGLATTAVLGDVRGRR